MSFEESPSLEQYRNGLPENIPDPSRRLRIFRKILLALLFVALGMLLVRLWQIGSLAGTGSVTGITLDPQGNPLRAEISVAGAAVFATADENGHFVLSGVPAGVRSLVIGYRAVGREISVQVAAGQTVDIGEFRFSPSDFQTAWGQP
ncbi:MAG: carboxypeptidase-like regulatory domain-containing protein, partial [Chloroflexi bacterium]|nr:carboxypeptidase-like regulatory domain-containing protein [Chloroflexota bacterium]